MDHALYQAAIDKWGVAPQVLMAMEEAAELTAELNRYFFRHRSDKASVAGEIADMEIMLGQLRLLIGDEAVDEAKKAKLARLAEKLRGYAVKKGDG